MLREMIAQFREAHAEVQKADRTPYRIKAVAGLIGYFVPAIAGGLIPALPTVFITIYGSNLARAIAIPLLGVAGLCLQD